VQIITDNGLNYKKVCKMISRKFSIMWQPCLAHTINLMLKAIGEFLEHKVVMTDLRQGFEFMTNTNMCVTALQEAGHYRRKEGSISSELTTKMPCDNNTSSGKL
jgi:hypothetical protein